MNKEKNKTWIEHQDLELIKNIESVDQIVYPDGTKGDLKGRFFII